MGAEYLVKICVIFHRLSKYKAVVSRREISNLIVTVVKEIRLFQSFSVESGWSGCVRAEQTENSRDT